MVSSTELRLTHDADVESATTSLRFFRPPEDEKKRAGDIALLT